MAKGVPGCGFPRPWSVYRWLPGEPATVDRVADVDQLAANLADFLTALYDPSGGPPAGEHRFFRGAALTTYDRDTREAIAALYDEIETDAATEVWEAALAAPWHGPPVWLHGDMTASNLLVVEGRPSAVIDLGCSASCDLGARPGLGALEGAHHTRRRPERKRRRERGGGTQIRLAAHRAARHRGDHRRLDHDRPHRQRIAAPSDESAAEMFGPAVR